MYQGATLRGHHGGILQGLSEKGMEGLSRWLSGRRYAVNVNDYVEDMRPQEGKAEPEESHVS